MGYCTVKQSRGVDLQRSLYLAMKIVVETYAKKPETYL